MTRLFLNRALAMVAVLFGLAVAVFVLQVVIPTDPARAMVGSNAPEEVVAQARADLGYDQPIPAQFAAYLGRITRGDLQHSLHTHNPVSDDLGRFAPATIELGFYAALIAGALGLGLGLLLVGGGLVGRVARVVLVGWAAVPAFLTGMLLIVVFYSWLHVLPGSGRVDDDLLLPDGPTGLLTVDALLTGQFALLGNLISHLVLPAVTLALLPAVAIARTLHASLEQVMGEDYIRTARSKGLRERTVLLRHALRNAAGPTLTMAGLLVGLMLGGVVVVEQIFSWPGLGLYVTQSIAYSDFPAITGTTLALGAAYVVINFWVDVAQAVADPRLRSA
ncbi:MAG: ABC transporter permease [Solirubrobacteraceae bacterium]|nr:ABC transporter permease [Solirubrobacteraceae bacterium]